MACNKRYIQMQMLSNLRLLIQPRKQIYTYLKKTCNVNFLIMVCSQKPNTIRNINKKNPKLVESQQ